jgi:hypothetical protein
MSNARRMAFPPSQKVCSIFCAAIFLTNLLQLVFFTCKNHRLTTQSTAQSASDFRICLFTADFFGLPTAAGTATFFELLGETLAAQPGYQVTLVGVNACHHRNASMAFRARKISPLSFVFPEEACDMEAKLASGLLEVPYDAMSLAALRWLKVHEADCDIVHLHEWGGAFSDVVTFHSFGGFR